MSSSHQGCRFLRIALTGVGSGWFRRPPGRYRLNRLPTVRVGYSRTIAGAARRPVWPETEPTETDRRSYADAEPNPFWLDRARPGPHPPLAGDAEADLVVVGGGLTGLWAAIRA